MARRSFGNVQYPPTWLVVLASVLSAIVVTACGPDGEDPLSHAAAPLESIQAGPFLQEEAVPRSVSELRSHAPAPVRRASGLELIKAEQPTSRSRIDHPATLQRV